MFLFADILPSCGEVLIFMAIAAIGLKTIFASDGAKKAAAHGAVSLISKFFGS